MTPNPSYLSLPVFGSGASLVVPIPGVYTGGYLPGQLLPAEYENWLLNRITTNGLASQTSVASMNAELVNLLTQAGLSPNSGDSTQVYAALQALYLGKTAQAADSALLGGQNSAFYRNSGNQNAGTLPLARLSGITTSQMAASAGILFSQMAAGSRAKTSVIGNVTGSVNAPAMAVGDTAILWYQTTGTTTFLSPSASGTYSVLLLAGGGSGTVSPKTSIAQNTNMYSGSLASGQSVLIVIYRES